MRKFYSLFIALLTVCGLAKAQVEFDFTGDKAYEQFGLAGFSATPQGEPAIHDGDFDEEKSSTIDGVTITVSPSGGTNANRMWTGSMRLYGGTLTIASSGKNITAIDFTLNSSKWGDNKADVGSLDKGKWTGDAASVVITIGGNTQIKKITVTLGGGDTPGPDPQPTIDWTSSATSPLTVAQVQEKAAQLEQGASSDKEVYVKGKISEIKSLDVSKWQRAQYFISDDGTTDAQFLVYNGYYLNGADFTDNEQIKVGDDVIVVGIITNYNGTLEFAADNKLYSHNGDTGGDVPGPQPGEAKGDGTLANPYNAVAASQLAKALPVGEISTESYYIEGKISSVKFYFDEAHGTATFFISDDGTTSNEFQVYSVYYLGNRAWKEGDTQIKVGDSVIIYGQLINYNGTPETASKKCCLYSLNGETDGGDTPQPTYKEYTAIAPMKADVTSSRVDVVFKANNLLVTFVSGNNLYLYDGTDGLLVYGANSGIKAGDKITADIKGQLYLYNGLTEIAVSAYENLTINSSDNAVEPQKVTVADVISNFKQYENELVTITDLTPAAEAWDSYRCATFSDDSDNEIVVCDNFKACTAVALNTEEAYTVTGFMAVRSTADGTEYRLYPRTPEDLDNGETPQPYELQGDGTLENPYTIADVLYLYSSNEAPAEAVWVKGTIIGAAKSTMNNIVKEQGEDLQAANIVLADAADETTAAKMIPVQLPAGKVRDALNLVDNFDNLNKNVCVYGTIEKYFTVAGVKSVTDYSMDGITTAISTVEATAAQGAIYTIAGQRIQHINHAGLYIVGGKKVAVK